MVNDVDRDLGDLSGAGTGGGEGPAEVGVHLAGLGGQVTGADEVAVGVLGFLAGDEHHLGSGRDDDVGVGGGKGQAFGIDELQCHRAFRPDLNMNKGASLCPSSESPGWTRSASCGSLTSRITLIYLFEM